MQGKGERVGYPVSENKCFRFYHIYCSLHRMRNYLTDVRGLPIANPVTVPLTPLDLWGKILVNLKSTRILLLHSIGQDLPDGVHLI